MCIQDLREKDCERIARQARNKNREIMKFKSVIGTMVLYTISIPLRLSLPLIWLLAFLRRKGIICKCSKITGNLDKESLYPSNASLGIIDLIRKAIDYANKNNYNIDAIRCSPLIMEQLQGETCIDGYNVVVGLNMEYDFMLYCGDIRLAYKEEYSEGLILLTEKQ